MLTAQIAALNSLVERDYDDAEPRPEWKARADEYGIDAGKHLWHAPGETASRSAWHRRSC